MLLRGASLLAASSSLAASSRVLPYAAALIASENQEVCSSGLPALPLQQFVRHLARRQPSIQPIPTPRDPRHHQPQWGALNLPSTSSRNPQPPPGPQPPRPNPNPPGPAAITARIALSKTLPDLQDLLHTNRRHLNCIHLSAGFTRLAKLLSKLRPPSDADLALARQILDSLVRSLQAADADLGSREIANIVCACGKLPLPVPPPFLDHLVALTLSEDGHLGRSTPQHLASLAYGFAQLGCHQPELWTPLLAAVEAKLGDLTQRQMATVLWALARAGLHQHSAVARIMDALVAGFRQVDHKSYVYLAWALAELVPARHALPGMLVDACARKVRLLDPPTLSQAVRMAAKVQLADGAAVHRLMTAVVRMPELFAPADLATVVWAAAALQYTDEATFTQLIGRAVAAAPKLDAKDLALLAASLAKAGHLVPSTTVGALEPVLAALRPQVARLSAMDVASLLGALGKMQHHDNPELLEAVGQQAVRLAPAMNAQMLSNTLWACAVLDFKPPELLEALEAALQQDGLQLVGQSLSVATWAAASLYPVGSAAVERLLEMVRESVGTLQAMDVVQVAYGLNKMHVTDPGLYLALEQHSSGMMGDFDGHMLVSLAFSFGWANMLSKAFIGHLLQHKNDHPERWGQEDLERFRELLSKLS